MHRKMLYKSVDYVSNTMKECKMGEGKFKEV